jgi:hypothetical protein
MTAEEAMADLMDEQDALIEQQALDQKLPWGDLLNDPWQLVQQLPHDEVRSLPAPYPAEERFHADLLGLGDEVSYSGGTLTGVIDYTQHQLMDLMDSEPSWAFGGPQYRGKQAEARQRTLSELFTASIVEAKFKRQARALPIVQPDGKVRVATLHTADVLWASRAITAWILPSLRRLKFSRDMLRAQPTELKAHLPDQLLYSADLSKSTDPISIELSRFVLTEIADIIGKPTWWDLALDAVINEHELSYDGNVYRTVCGALMGLGPGWTVLSLLNAWAAENAGARPGSYTVCGDDLIGLWTREIIAKYELNLLRLSLVPNKSKSFISRNHGVFCERLIVRTGEYSAYGDEVTRIGEATGARAINGAHGRMVHDHLLKIRCHKVLRHAADRLLKRLSLSKLISGPFSCGGLGGSTIKARTVISFAKYGPLQLQRGHRDERLSELRKALRTIPRSKTGIPASEALDDGRYIVETQHRKAYGRGQEPFRLVEGRTLRSEGLRRAQTVRDLIRSERGPLNALKKVLDQQPYVRCTASIRRDVLQAVRHRAYEKALRILRRSWDLPLETSAVRNESIRIFGTSIERLELKTLQPAGARRDSRQA